MILLSKEDCYCGLVDFYKNVAIKDGASRLFCLTACFDCRKICVTPSVQHEICAFYKDVLKASDTEIAMLFACVGPKANLESADYAAEIEPGFVFEESQADISANSGAQKFNLGELVVTKGIDERMQDNAFYSFIAESLRKFYTCDWGNMCDDDKSLSDNAVKHGNTSIHGVYLNEKTGEEIWIITEADRSVTTILFPEES